MSPIFRSCTITTLTLTVAEKLEQSTNASRLVNNPLVLARNGKGAGDVSEVYDANTAAIWAPVLLFMPKT
jgi:hypothetical protein